MRRLLHSLLKTYTCLTNCFYCGLSLPSDWLLSPGPHLLNYIVFLFLILFRIFLFLVPCGRLSWLAVSFWPHVNITYRVVSYRISYRKWVTAATMKVAAQELSIDERSQYTTALDGKLSDIRMNDLRWRLANYVVLIVILTHVAYTDVVVAQNHACCYAEE